MQISWPLICHRRVSPPPVFMGMVWEEGGVANSIHGGVWKGVLPRVWSKEGYTGTSNYGGWGVAKGME